MSAVSKVIKRIGHTQVLEFFTENNFEISKIINNKYGENVLVLIFTEKIVTADSGGVLERRFIACILASAFLCALPPPPADSQVRSINFVGFFACFHRYVNCLWNRRLDWLNDRTLLSLSPAQGSHWVSP